MVSLAAVAVRNIWGYIYTNEIEVVRYLASVMPVLATSNFMDGIQGVLSGTRIHNFFTYISHIFITKILVTACLKFVLPIVFVGTARGCGWQKLGAYVNLGAYYLVGLPCAITLTFVFHLGGKVRILVISYITSFFLVTEIPKFSGALDGNYWWELFASTCTISHHIEDQLG